MNWAFYSTLSRPLKQPDTVGGDRREEGSRVRPATWQRVGRRTGEPEEQAGHPRPAREAGPAEPWAARPRPAVAMESGRGGGQTGPPGRASLPGAQRRPREAASLARRRLRLRGCSVFPRLGPEEVSRVLETFVCPSSHCVVRTVPPKGGLGAFFALLVCLLLHRPCQSGRLRGEVFFVCW